MKSNNKPDYSQWMGEKTETFNCEAELYKTKIAAIAVLIQLGCVAVNLLPHYTRFNIICAAWCGAWMGVVIRDGWFHYQNYRMIKAMGDAHFNKQVAEIINPKELEELKKITGME